MLVCVVNSLLGSVKQPRGFGSQHFATVNVTGLPTGGQVDRETETDDRQTGGQVHKETVAVLVVHVAVFAEVVQFSCECRTCKELIFGVQTLTVTNRQTSDHLTASETNFSNVRTSLTCPAVTCWTLCKPPCSNCVVAVLLVLVAVFVGEAVQSNVIGNRCTELIFTQAAHETEN